MVIHASAFFSFGDRTGDFTIEWEPTEANKSLMVLHEGFSWLFQKNGLILSVSPGKKLEESSSEDKCVEFEGHY